MTKVIAITNQAWSDFCIRTSFGVAVEKLMETEISSSKTFSPIVNVLVY